MKKKFVSAALAAMLILSAFSGCGVSNGAADKADADSTADKSEFVLPEGCTLTEDGTLGDLLVVIDMQNVYLEGEPWACTNTSEIAQKIQGLIDDGVCDNVVFTRYIAPENPTGTWVNYNEAYADINANEYYNEVVDNLLPYTEIYPTYDKSTYSSYGNEDFKTLCSMADRVVLTGVVAECCVLATAVDAIDTGVPVVYLTDGVSGGSEENEDEIEALIASFSPVHTSVMTMDEYTESEK